MIDDDPRAHPPQRPIVVPGEALRRWLSAHDMAHYVFAAKVGISTKHLSEILRGKKRFSVAVGLRMAMVTGHPRDHWALLQTRWEVAQYSDAHPRSDQEIERGTSTTIRHDP